MKILDKLLNLLGLPSLEVDTSPPPTTFDPTIKWKDPLREASVSECIERINGYLDDIPLMSNEPIKDTQAWTHLKFLALIGDKVHTAMLSRGKRGVVEWAESLPEDPK